MTDTAPPEHTAPPGRPAPRTGTGTPAGGEPIEPATPSARGHPGRRRAIVAVVAVAAAVALGAAVLAARGDDDEPAAPPASAPTATTTTAPPATAATTTTPSSTPTTTAPGTTVTTGAPLADGRHPVFLAGLDVEGRSVEFDLVQFLTGDEADAAFHRDHPDEVGGVPNDYYIVNDNPRLRTLPVADDVDVTVVQTPTSANAPHSIAFEGLPDYVAGDPQPGDEQLWPNPFWLTVEGGTVVAITEQYIP